MCVRLNRQTYDLDPTNRNHCFRMVWTIVTNVTTKASHSLDTWPCAISDMALEVERISHANRKEALKHAHQCTNL